MHPFYTVLLLELALAIIYFLSSPSFDARNISSTKSIATPKKNKSIYLVFAFGILLFFHAFRDPYSLFDIPEYAEAYKEALGYSWQRVLTEPFYSLKCETGFRIIIKGIASLFSSYQMLFVITSIFLIYCFFNATRNYSVFYCISVMVFMTDSFAQSLFMLRAFVAIGILLLSFPFIIDRKIIPFLLLNLLAMSVHLSSVIFFPVYFLYGIKNTKLLWTTFICFGAALILYFNSIINIVIERYLTGYSYYLVYVDNYEGASWKMPALLGTLLIMRIVILRKHFFNPGITRLLSIISVLAFLVYVAGMGFGLTSRMAMFFTNMTFLILPDNISHMKNKKLGILIAVSYILFTGFFFLRSCTSSEYINYRLIW